MNRTFGCDPSSAHIGFGNLGADGTIEALASIRCLDEPAATYTDRVVPLLACADLDDTDELWIERPPPTAHKDANHGHQAVIGYAIGVHTGLVIAAWTALGGGKVHPIDVTPWRNDMIIGAARRGVIVQPPSHRPVFTGQTSNRTDVVRGDGAGLFLVKYRPCDHTWPRGAAAGGVHVHELKNRPAACPECSAAASDPTRDIRDRWKELACHVAQKLAPAMYSDLMGQCRARARTDRPDHRLEGLSDACEALGIAIAGHVRSEPASARA